MGTNFEVRINNCEHCQRYDEIHLGKSSYGWKFCFQLNGKKYYKNIEELKEWLKDKEIYNEYENPISYDKFWEIVEMRQKLKKSQDDDYVINIDGYDFLDYEFS